MAASDECAKLWDQLQNVDSSDEEDDMVDHKHASPKQNVLLSSTGAADFDAHKLYASVSEVTKAIDVAKESKQRFLKTHGYDPVPGHVVALLAPFATAQELEDMKSMSKKAGYALFDKYYTKKQNSYTVRLVVYSLCCHVLHAWTFRFIDVHRTALMLTFMSFHRLLSSTTILELLLLI